MILEVLDGGLLTTVQDAGRPDWMHVGVPMSGAADAWSLAVANVLAGNAPGDAGLEITLLGPRLRVRDGGVIAVAGAELGAHAGGRRLTVDRTHAVRAGDVIAFDPAGDRAHGHGARCYLAIPGGIDVPVVLGSRSTCLPGGFGGFDGRPIRSGDVIRAGGGITTSIPPAAVVWPGADDADRADQTGPIALRLVRGPAHGMDELLAGSWRVSPAADRVGIRLDGALLSERGRGEVLTHGMPLGAIQVPPDGRPIILSVDHQTTGGYRVPAVVIAADLPLVGQLAPGAAVRFEAVDLAAADAALRDRRTAFAAGARAVREAASWDRLASSAGG